VQKIDLESSDADDRLMRGFDILDANLQHLAENGSHIQKTLAGYEQQLEGVKAYRELLKENPTIQ